MDVTCFKEIVSKKKSTLNTILVSLTIWSYMVLYLSIFDVTFNQVKFFDVR